MGTGINNDGRVAAFGQSHCYPACIVIATEHGNAVFWVVRGSSQSQGNSVG